MTTFMTTRPDPETNERPHALAHATFIISGESVDPAFWTSYFGVRPSSIIVKGEPYLYPSGKSSKHPGKIGFWSFESAGEVHSDQLEPHLRWLVEALKLPRAELRELITESRAKMFFWCYWANYAGDRISDVPDDIQAMMASLGGTIEIDEYR
ncbi:MAG: hypothetical protein QOC89_1601 [Paraburkholderia sp.]|jgi:Domain of unknown function (DUF4279)|nr:hypothetical protein [Paraburkholderia sp.]